MFSYRIKRIVELITPADVVADVGCDHGYVGVELLKKNICKKVIFSDISSESLQKAEKLAKFERVEERAEFVCSNGLSHLKSDVDYAIICGMGGMEIQNILQNSKHKAKKYLFQPMKNVDIFRDYLYKNNYFIIFDKKILDKDKFYDIIIANEDKNVELPNNYYDVLDFGITNLNHPDEIFLKYLKYEEQKTASILSKICKSSLDYLKISKYLEKIRRQYEISSELSRS